MSASIAELYGRYEVPPNLQRHMLRVAAVAEMILDAWHGPPVDRRRVRRVLLVHDIGNIVKADYEHSPEMLEEEQGRVDHWRDVQARYRAQFGRDDALATASIARAAGLDAREIDLLERMSFNRNDAILAGDDLEEKLAAYADQRVAPRGILPVRERLDEALERYRDAPGTFMASARAAHLIECAPRIEVQIFAHCRLAPTAIDDPSAAPYIARLHAIEYDAEGTETPPT
jgi:hypothetical protein